MKAGHRIDRRRIPDYELVFFPKETSTVYRTETGDYRADRPFVILTRPGELHSFLFDDMQPTRHLFIHFDAEADFDRSRYPALDQADCVLFRLHEQALIPQLMKQLLYTFHKRPARWKWHAEMLFLSVLEELEAQCTGPNSSLDEAKLPPPLYKAMDYIEKHVTDKIDISRLAEASGWTHEHFTRTFQRHVGVPPKEWIIKRRIDRAAQLILQRTGSLKQIAREAGFADEYYFYRVFRRLMGMTASEYRQRYSDPRLLQMAPPDDWNSFYPLNHIIPVEQRKR